MKYTIVQTDKANDQLNEAIHYIAADSGSAEVALQYLSKIENAIMQLEDYSYIGKVPRYSILQRKGYRVLIVERHLVFYRAEKARKTVTIYAVVDGRREYRNLV